MHFRTLNSADLLFYNENNPCFNYKPKRFTSRYIWILEILCIRGGPFDGVDFHALSPIISF
jgi:hypothetical protein